MRKETMKKNKTQLTIFVFALLFFVVSVICFITHMKSNTDYDNMEPYAIIDTLSENVDDILELPNDYKDIEVELSYNYVVTEEYVTDSVYYEMLMLDANIPSTNEPITDHSVVTVLLKTDTSEDTFTNIYLPFAFFGDEIRESLVGKVIGDEYDVDVKIDEAGTLNRVHVTVLDVKADLTERFTDEWVATYVSDENIKTTNAFKQRVRDDLEKQYNQFLILDLSDTYVGVLMQNYVDIEFDYEELSFYVDAIYADWNKQQTEYGIDVRAYYLDEIGMTEEELNEYVKNTARTSMLRDYIYILLFSEQCDVTEAEFNSNYTILSEQLGNIGSYQITMSTVRDFVEAWIYENIEYTN